MRACFNQSTVNQTDAQTFVEAAASVGFQGVEFRVEKLRAYLASNHRWSQLKELLTDHHLESVCLNSFEDFSYVPVENFDAVLHRAREFSTICRDTGCPSFVACPNPVQKDLTKAEALEMTADRLRKIARVSSEYSVNIAFEFLAEASANTVRDAVEIVKAADAPNVGLVIDTFHYYVGRSTLDALEDFPLEKLWLVHFNDVEPGPLETLTDENRLLPGRGVLKMREFRDWLKEHGWDGWLSVEMFRPEYWKMNPLEVANESYKSLKPYL